ncbi:UNKNOWN [Stylonychia lemnae]|uniref:C2 domain-containing protein n=1 Tax=Stylonychia lemnae TaxID=5949 RepID=A0A077ZUB4_STYLE|nr:UNKNOWN [Stylonychia lemnae]|eukprot:CDW72880.1 UNKNOWN [Stylonychia lemnae]
MQDSGFEGGVYEVTIVSADLRRYDESTLKIEPFVVAEFIDQKFQTDAVEEGGQNPVWNHSFQITVNKETLKDTLALAIMGKDATSDDIVGNTVIQLKEILPEDGIQKEGHYEIHYGGEDAGSVIIQTRYIEPLISYDFVPSVLTLKINEGIISRELDNIANSSSYLKIEHNGVIHRTKIHKNGGKRPIWDQQFDLVVQDLQEDIILSIIDEELGETNPICVRQLKARHIFKPSKIHYDWIGFQYESEKVGKVNMEFTFRDIIPKTLDLASVGEIQIRVNYASFDNQDSSLEIIQPSVSIEYDDQVLNTSVPQESPSTTPLWNEVLQFKVNDLSLDILIKVQDEDPNHQQLLGQNSVKLQELIQNHVGLYPLFLEEQQVGLIYLEVEYLEIASGQDETMKESMKLSAVKQQSSFKDNQTVYDQTILVQNQVQDDQMLTLSEHNHMSTVVHNGKHSQIEEEQRLNQSSVRADTVLQNYQYGIVTDESDHLLLSSGNLGQTLINPFSQPIIEEQEDETKLQEEEDLAQKENGEDENMQEDEQEPVQQQEEEEYQDQAFEDAQEEQDQQQEPENDQQQENEYQDEFQQEEPPQEEAVEEPPQEEAEEEPPQEEAAEEPPQEEAGEEAAQEEPLEEEPQEEAGEEPPQEEALEQLAQEEQNAADEEEYKQTEEEYQDQVDQDHQQVELMSMRSMKSMKSVQSIKQTMMGTNKSLKSLKQSVKSLDKSMKSLNQSIKSVKNSEQKNQSILQSIKKSAKDNTSLYQSIKKSEYDMMSIKQEELDQPEELRNTFKSQLSMSQRSAINRTVKSQLDKQSTLQKVNEDLGDNISRNTNNNQIRSTIFNQSLKSVKSIKSIKTIKTIKSVKSIKSIKSVKSLNNGQAEEGHAEVATSVHDAEKQSNLEDLNERANEEDENQLQEQQDAEQQQQEQEEQQLQQEPEQQEQEQEQQEQEPEQEQQQEEPEQEQEQPQLDEGQEEQQNEEGPNEQQEEQQEKEEDQQEQQHQEEQQQEEDQQAEAENQSQHESDVKFNELNLHQQKSIVRKDSKLSSIKLDDNEQEQAAQEHYEDQQQAFRESKSQSELNRILAERENEEKLNQSINNNRFPPLQQEIPFQYKTIDVDKKIDFYGKKNSLGATTSLNSTQNTFKNTLKVIKRDQSAQQLTELPPVHAMMFNKQKNDLKMIRNMSQKKFLKPLKKSQQKWDETFTTVSLNNKVGAHPYYRVFFDKPSKKTPDTIFRDHPNSRSRSPQYNERLFDTQTSFNKAKKTYANWDEYFHQMQSKDNIKIHKHFKEFFDKPVNYSPKHQPFKAPQPMENYQPLSKRNSQNNTPTRVSTERRSHERIKKIDTNRYLSNRSQNSGVMRSAVSKDRGVGGKTMRYEERENRISKKYGRNAVESRGNLFQ